jgi:hypothetical protein
MKSTAYTPVPQVQVQQACQIRQKATILAEENEETDRQMSGVCYCQCPSIHVIIKYSYVCSFFNLSIIDYWNAASPKFPNVSNLTTRV